MDDEIDRRHAVGREAGGPVSHGLEWLPGPQPPALEARFEKRKDAGEERRAAHEQDIRDHIGGNAGLLDDFVEGGRQVAEEAVLLQHAREPFPAEAEEASAGRSRAVERIDARGGEQEGRALVEKYRLLDPASFGEHQSPPEPRAFVVAFGGRRGARLPAEVGQDPAIHGVAPDRVAALREDERLPTHGSLWR